MCYYVLYEGFILFLIQPPKIASSESAPKVSSEPISDCETYLYGTYIKVIFLYFQ